MIRMPLAAALAFAAVLPLAGCTGGAPPAGPPATPSAASSGTPGPGDAVIRFLRCGPETCGGGDRLSVAGDGRAVTLRDGELVALALPVSEVEDMRARLVKSLAVRPGTLDRTGGATDQPFTVITAVASDGRVHETRLQGGPLVEDEWFVAEAERLTTLTRRVLTSGAVDRTAPIEVVAHRDENTDPVRRATWPTGVPAPALSSGPHGLTRREYRGREAAAVRASLGAAGDDVAVRVGGETLIASWQAVLP
ncbi:hypothetical protein GCM10010517_60600 [Streptosporangium fragile]|uniref:Lipoprotein n=1 Tax=Streptosporangium fragile TaxID=46186 RepID=A0ABN3W500_9ACTN